MSRSTDDLILRLSGSLPPVKPLRRLRETLLVVVGIPLPVYALWLMTRGIPHGFAQGEAPESLFLAVMSILVLLAGGGLVAGLAAAIPGREGAERIGRVIFWAVSAIGLLLVGYQCLHGTGPIVKDSLSGIPCALFAAMLSIPSAAMVTRNIMRGAALDRHRAIALACAGSMGVGAVIVHLSCANSEPLHLLAGHALSPLVGGTIVLLGVSMMFRYASRAKTSTSS